MQMFRYLHSYTPEDNCQTVPLRHCRILQRMTSLISTREAPSKFSFVSILRVLGYVLHREDYSASN